MTGRECPFCHRTSYSASNSEVWACPYCKRLVTKKDEKSADSKKD